MARAKTADFTPVASYPGLTAEVRARLGEMKVAPVNAEMISETVTPEAGREVALRDAPHGEAGGSELAEDGPRTNPVEAAGQLERSQYGLTARR